MSVLFPKVNKMPTWDWRPIYYDPKKDEMDRKLKALQAKRATEESANADGKSADLNYTPSLHRGSFRESHEDHMSMRQKANRQSRMILWIIVLCLLIFTFYVVL